MHIKMDLDALTLDDLEALEAARSDPDKGVWTTVRELFARFAYDKPDGEKLEFDDAMVRVGKLTMNEVLKILETLSSQMEEVADLAIPPSSGDS